MVMSGETMPRRSRRSHPPSSVSPGFCQVAARPGISADLAALSRGLSVVDGGLGLDARALRPTSGRTVSVTRCQSARASGSSDLSATGTETSKRAGRQQQIGEPTRRHATGNLFGFGARTPEGVKTISALDRAAGILSDP